MNRNIAKCRVITDDRLVMVWRLPNGDCRSQGKRVSASCPMTAEERRAYVKSNGKITAAVVAIRDNRKCSLAEAWEIFKQARGVNMARRSRPQSRT